MSSLPPDWRAGARAGTLSLLALAVACSEVGTNPEVPVLESAYSAGSSQLGTPQMRTFEVCSTFPKGGAQDITVRVDVVEKVNTTSPRVVPTFRVTIPPESCLDVWKSGAEADRVTVKHVQPSGQQVGYHNSLATGPNVIQRGFTSNDSDFTGKIGGDVGRSVTFVTEVATSGSGSIGDVVWKDQDRDGIQDSGEPGISGVTVVLTDAGGSVVAKSNTSSSGSYLFSGLPLGQTYTVEVDPNTLPPGSQASPSGTGSNTGVDSNGSSATVTLTSSKSTDMTVDFGYYEVTGVIGDVVWNDVNGNGLQLEGEPGIGNVRIRLKNASGTVVATTRTRSDGKWILSGMPVGQTYTVEVDTSTLPSNLAPSPTKAGSDNKWDSNGSPATVKLTAANRVNTTIDFGYTATAASTGSIGDLVWDDQDQDGLQDTGEPGIGGVRIDLRGSGGSVIASTTTNGQGYYRFGGLKLGRTYSVEVRPGSLPTDYVASPSEVGSNRSIDSNGSPATVTLTSGSPDDLTVAFGYYEDSNPTNPTNPSNPTTPRGDVTKALENLGEPFYANRYAKNPWDMQLYNGRLYVGHGNSSNEGPSGSGRSTFGDVWYLDLKTENWVKQWDVPQDQIDAFRVINGELYMPGHDAGPGATEQDGYYRLRGTSWSKHRKKAIHVYDVYEYGGYIFTAIGASFGAGVRRTPDQGRTITEYNLVQKDPSRQAGRAFSLFEIAGKLYVSATHMWADMDPLSYRKSKIFRYTGNDWVHVRQSFFPGAPTDELRVTRPVNFGNKTIYIGAMNYNDHQWKPYALYKASSEWSISQVKLPYRAKPMDLLVRGGDLFVLAYVKNGDGTFTTYVFTSSDASTFKEVLSFRNDGFGRSFEIDGSDYYFGIGSDGAMSCNPNTYSCTWTDKNFAPMTGDILRLR